MFVFLSQILHFTHIFESVEVHQQYQAFSIEATPINLASTEPPVD
jgi:hypothetical protein